MKRPRVPEFSRLSWRDVDPARREFDPAAVPALVRSLPPVAEMPPADADWRLVSFWFDRMTAALVERLGDWAAGWPYTVEMEDFQGRGRMPTWRNGSTGSCRCRTATRTGGNARSPT